MRACLRETDLHKIWHQADGGRVAVATAKGDRYRVLYAGMPGGSYGPDFRDAVLEAEDGSEVVGDVEIHRTASDWYTHGHDTDGRYGRVAFHMIDETPPGFAGTLNSLGMAVPQVPIAWGPLAQRTAGYEFRAEIPGESTVSDPSQTADWLDSAGDESFALKMGGKQLDVENFGPDLALQLAIFEGLGFPRNRESFRHLAKRLPWPFLAGLINPTDSHRMSNAERASGLLRWAAGFGERPQWTPVPELFGGLPNWVAAAGRPANRPKARIEAAAHLVTEWWRYGGPLRHALKVTRNDRPATRLVDGYRCPGGVLGAGRAGEIVVNAVLPTIAAWARDGRDGERYSDAMWLYRGHPLLPRNSVLDEAKQTLKRRGVVLPKLKKARQQLGAMHIYKTMLLRPRVTRQMQLGSRALSS